MRSVVLVVLAGLGIVVCVRIHLADSQYRAGRAILESHGDPREAAVHLERALGSGAADPLYALRRGLASLELGTTGELEVAIEWFRLAARLGPVMARCQFWWGVALERLGRTDEAVVRYEAARRLAPYDVNMNRRIAESYVDRWGQTRAEEDLRRAFDAYHALRLVEEQATVEGLTRLLSRPLLRYEDLTRVVPRNAAERLTLAETLAAAGRDRWAVRAFDEADELAKAGGALAIRGRMLRYRSLVEKYPVAALEVLEEVRALAGDGFDQDLELGRTLLRTGNIDGALGAFRRHLLRRGEDDLGAAITEIHATFEAVQKSTEALDVTARARVELDLWESVAKEYTSFESRDIHLHAARAAFELGHAEAALQWLRPYLRWRPRDVAAIHLEARCYNAIGKPETAKRRLLDALRERPGDPELRRFAAELGIEDLR